MTPHSLRTEYLPSAPLLTLDEPRPRVSWLLSSERMGAAQTAYRVRGASRPQLLRDDAPDLWDSGRVVSGVQSQVEVDVRRPLTSRQEVWWDVQVWDENGEASDPSEPAYFQMGLLSREDWSGQFIDVPSLIGTGRTPGRVPLVRRTFNLPSVPSRSRLYIAALGLYDASINGHPVTTDVLRPGWTDYRKRLTYQAYDVAPYLKPGENMIEVIVGDGWYCGRVAHMDRGILYRQVGGAECPAILAQIECDHPNGQRSVVATDHTWQWCPSGTLSADLLAGETHDARQDPAVLVRQGAKLEWRPVHVRAWPEKTRLEISPSQPVRPTQTLEPLASPRPTAAAWDRRAYVYDFGQNLVGVVQIKGRGPRGCTITIRHAEALRPDGTIDTSNLRGVEACDQYTFCGDAAGETWQPRFTFHGFRYVEISYHLCHEDRALPDRVDISTIEMTAVVFGTDVPFHATLETNHPLLDQLYRNVKWGQRGNFLEVPTDCPQRDERLGWTGDTQIFASTAACNAEVGAFFTKWMRDVEDAQHESGAVPSVVPDVPIGGVAGDGGPGWSDAVVVVPWAVYRAYGDRRILERSWETIRRWGDYQIATSVDGVRCRPGSIAHVGFGDWLALEGSDGLNAWHTLTPRELIGTAYHAYSMGLASSIARLVGDEATSERFEGARLRAVDAFNRHFVTPAGTIAVPSQTAHLMALAYDLLPESVRPGVFDSLLHLLEKRDWHLATGFLGTPLLCPVLTRFGRPDLAYRLLLQESYPGWLYPVTLGATTMWERWNSWNPDKGFVEVGMNSLNHYAYGAVGEWMIECIGGIAMQPTHPDGAVVRIAPVPSERITHATAVRHLPRGTVRVEWRQHAQQFELATEIPPNVAAIVVLPGPDAQSHTVGSGRHRFLTRL